MYNDDSITKPLVTVAIPVYRGELYIKKAIDSVLSQSFTDFELLVIDNDSDDQTVDIVRSYSDARIVLVRNEKNIGAESNWNKCITLAKGSYIKILPHDDILQPNCLKEQVEILDADQEERIALVFCLRNIINDAGKQLAVRRIRGLTSGIVAGQKLIRKCVRLGTNLIGEPGAVLFRSKMAKQVGEFNGTIPYVIDLDYWVRLLAHGDAFFIDRPLSAFRVSSESWSVEIGSRQSEDFRQFINYIAEKQECCLSSFDKAIGRIMATLNGLARRIFYLLLIR